MTAVLRKMSPEAFISGITRKDRSYLAEFLLAKGYEVHGIIRRTSSRIRTNERDVFPSRYGDLTNAAHLSLLIKQIQLGRGLQSESLIPRAREIRPG